MAGLQVTNETKI